jgi:outer membrane receptor for ferrienterochelin and colicin
VQSDRSVSQTTSQVMALDAHGNQISPDGIQPSDVPSSIVDAGAKTEWIYSAYVQDEWKLIPTLTFNYGLRFDRFTAYTADSQLSPRFNAVWQAMDNTTVHLGYSRYFSPPPFELVGNETVAKFANTTGAAPFTSFSPFGFDGRFVYGRLSVQW